MHDCSLLDFGVTMLRAQGGRVKPRMFGGGAGGVLAFALHATPQP